MTHHHFLVVIGRSLGVLVVDKAQRRAVVAGRWLVAERTRKGNIPMAQTDVPVTLVTRFSTPDVLEVGVVDVPREPA